MRLDSIIVGLRGQGTGNRQQKKPVPTEATRAKYDSTQPLPSAQRSTNRYPHFLLPVARPLLPATPDDNSLLEPRLPIPNRTVKRQHADDSTEFPCESRSLSGTSNAKRPANHRWAFCFSCGASNCAPRRLCNVPADSAHVRLLMRRLRPAFSCQGLDAAGGGCKS